MENVRLLTLPELDARGRPESSVRADVAAGRLVRVRRGFYAERGAWDAQFIEGRHRARARALAARSPGVVLAGISAAAVHELPLFREGDERLHTVSEGYAASSTSGVMRHRDELADGDIATVDGLRVTSLSRTVFDLIRRLPFEAAVAVADAALAKAEKIRGGGAEELRALVAARLDAAPGERGVRRGRTVLAFADAASGSPGESASRWMLHVIGFRDIRIQIPFDGPGGVVYAIDFRFRGVWGEFDGAAKYRDPEFLKGRTPEQALLDEKEREDWIRARSGDPFVRWMDRHIKTPETLRARLAAFGIRP